MPRPKRTPRIPCAPPPPKVVMIDGSQYKPEIITQEALDDALGLQQAAWYTLRGALSKIAVLEEARERGAQIEPGHLRLIPELLWIESSLGGSGRLHHSKKEDED